MTEVAALEVQERIKIVDAAFTWPHPTDKGYFVNAIFVRTDDDTPYLIYCPRTSTSISIDEETFNPYFLIACEPLSETRQISVTQRMTANGKDILFYVIRIGAQEPKEISKKEIEKMFGVKVVD